MGPASRDRSLDDFDHLTVDERYLSVPAVGPGVVRTLDIGGAVLGGLNVEHVVRLKDRDCFASGNGPLDSGFAGKIRGDVHDTLPCSCLKKLTQVILV